MLTVKIAASASGPNTILPAVAGYKYRVIAFMLSFADPSPGTIQAKFQSGASTDLTGLMYGAAGVVVPSPPLPATSRASVPGQFTTAAGEALNLNLSGNVAVGGFVVYEKIPASM